jgi:hypothetical protein
LGRVVEQRNRLRLTVVTQLEVFLLERCHQAAVSVGDGHEHAHGVAAPAKHRLLCGGSKGKDAEGERRKGEESDPHASMVSSIRAFC